MRRNAGRNARHQQPQPPQEVVLPPAPMSVDIQQIDRKIFIWLGNAAMISMFVVLTALGIEYMTPVTFGGAVIMMCYFCIIVIFFLDGYKMFLAPVREFVAGVLVNRWFGQKTPRNDIESLGFKPTKSLEEVGSTVWNPKFPWQSIIYVNTQRHEPMGKEDTAYSKDGIQFFYKWFGTLRAARGYCSILVRIGVPAAISIMTKATGVAMAQNMNRHNWRYLSKHQSELGQEVSMLYGGDGSMSERELRCGLAAEGLGYDNLRRSPELQKAEELKERTKAVERAVNSLMSSKKGHSRDNSLTRLKAIDRVLAQEGKAQLHVYEGIEKANVLLDANQRGNNRQT